METQAHRLAVGSFVILIVVLLFASIMWFSRFEWKEKGATFVIHFKGSVSGLRPNEAVKFHGLPIGKVKSITIDPEKISIIKVKVTIEKPDLIRGDSIASIEAQGLTGFSYVQIQGGSQDQPVLKPQKGKKYAVIPSKQSNIELLLNAGPIIVEKVNNIADNISKLLNEDNTRSLQEAARNIADLADKISQKSPALDEILTSTQKAAQRFDDFMTHLSQETGPLLKGAKKSLDAFQILVDSNQKPLHHFMQRGLKDFQELAQELRTTNKKLNGILNEVENSPLQFLKKKPTAGVTIP